MTSLCRHILPAGRRCTQPAVNNTLYCRHHQFVKVTLAKVTPKPDPYKFHHPLPFVFTEDRAALQINYSLVIAALNDKRIDVPTANAFNRLLRSCEMSLRRGPLHEPAITRSREEKPRPTRRNPNEKWLVDDEDDTDPRDAHDSQPEMVQRVILTPAGEEIAPACDLLDEDAGESHGQYCPCQRCSEEFRNAPPEPHHRQCECGLCVLTASELSSRPESAQAAGVEGPAFTANELSSRPESAQAVGVEGPAFSELGNGFNNQSQLPTNGCHPERSATIGERAVEGPASSEPSTDAGCPASRRDVGNEESSPTTASGPDSEDDHYQKLAAKARAIFMQLGFPYEPPKTPANQTPEKPA